MFSNSTDRSGGIGLELLALTLLLVGALSVVGLATIGAAQTGEEIANETVTVEDPDNESVWVDVEWAANGSLDVELYDADSADDRANMTMVGNTTLEGSADETSSFAFDGAVNETGNYTVVAYGNESDVSGLWVSTSEEDDGTAVIGGGDDGSGSASEGAILGGLAVVVIAAVVLRGRS